MLLGLQIRATTFVQYLLHTSAMVFLQELKMNDTDEIAFTEWLERQEGEWCCAISRADSRSGGVAILWRRAWQVELASQSP